MTNHRILTLSIQSELLAGNRAGDSAIRPVTAYIPFDSGKELIKYPVIYLLAPWTNAGRAQFEWKPFRESLQERLDRLIFEKKIPPLVLVAVDTYSKFGGSQYIDSAFFGPHGSHVVQELLPFCEKYLPILPGARHRAVMGRSSGGFGALRFGTDFSGVFSAIACHSGDLGFELLFGGSLVDFADRLAKYRGSVSAYLAEIQAAPKVSGGDIHLLNLLGMAGFYSPNLENPDGFDLPIDLHTGELRPEIWQRWLDHDPVKRDLKGLKALKTIYIDCGNRDQYHLLYGARQLRNRLQQAHLTNHYFEFNDDHSGTEYRYDQSLPILAEAIV